MDMQVDPGAVIAKLQNRLAQLELEVAVRDVAIDQLNQRVDDLTHQVSEWTDVTAKSGANGHVHVENRDPLLHD